MVAAKEELSWASARSSVARQYWVTRRSGMEMERVRKIEIANRQKYEVVSDAQATGMLKLVTGESAPFIPKQGDMTVSEGDRMFHWWKDCGDKDNSMGWLECTVERKCGNTHETRYWVYYSCDKKETKHDFDAAAYGVNRAEGHRWVFAAAERLAVPHSRPAAAAAVTAAATVTLEMSTQTAAEES